MNMELLDIVSAVFASSVILVYAALLCAALILIVFTLKKESRFRRIFQRHSKKREKIHRKGHESRESLAASRQKKNLKEMASIINAQLKKNRVAIQLGTYHQSTMFLKDSIAKLEFHRLYAMHALLSKTNEEQMSDELDKFLQQELEYGHLGKYREVCFQDILHRQD